MLKENERVKKIFEKNNENRNNILKDAAKKYDQTLERGKYLSKDALRKIEKTGKTGTEFIKSQHYWESIKSGSLKIKAKSIKQENELKKQSHKFYKKIINGFFYFFEALVGRIKLGTQYGSHSLEILERLAKLKEFGILTDEEFTKKKKKILDRI